MITEYCDLFNITGGYLYVTITKIVEKIKFIKYIIWEYFDYKYNRY